jgi:uncharacterized BrkB/YihY/UPF0761 family membrane protein
MACDLLGVVSFGEIEGEQRAASFAYYALFSLFPLFALLLTIGSAFVDSGAAISAAERGFSDG